MNERRIRRASPERGSRRVALAGVLFALVGATGLAAAGAAWGQDQAAAMQKACAADYQTLCSGTRPGGGRVIACFTAHSDKLSADCLQALQHARTVSRAAAPTETDAEVDLTVHGVARTYLVHIPGAPPPSGGYPLVLAFHGGGTGASGMIHLVDFDPLADKLGFIAVYPNGVDGRWNDGRTTMDKVDDVGFVSAILDDLERRYPVNAGRIYATGISNGALFSERLGCELADRIAAIAPVVGTMPADIAPACAPARPVSVMQVGSTADPTAPYKGGAVEAFQGLGHGGSVMGDEDTTKLWARLDGCGAPSAPVALAPIAPSDGTSITETRFGACRDGTTVMLVTVIGAGHTWPSGPQYLPEPVIGLTTHQFKGSVEIIDFFLSRAPR